MRILEEREILDGGFLEVWNRPGGRILAALSVKICEKTTLKFGEKGPSTSHYRVIVRCPNHECHTGELARPFIDGEDLHMVFIYEGTRSIGRGRFVSVKERETTGCEGEALIYEEVRRINVA